MSKLVAMAEIEHLSLFQGLSNQDLALVSRSLYRKSFSAGTTLLNAGQNSGTVYILLSGTAKVCAEGGENGDLTISHCGPGEILGEISAIDGLGHSANVIALEALNTGSMHRDQFHLLLKTIPQLSANVMLSLARRVRLSTAYLQSMAVDDVTGRVARQLLAFVQSHGQPNAKGEVLIPFRLTQQDMANMIGASRARVQQALATFEKSDWIRTGRCPLTQQCFRITVRDPEALKDRCFQHQNS